MNKRIKTDLAPIWTRWISLVIDGTIINCALMLLSALFRELTLEKIYYTGMFPIIFISYCVFMEYKFEATAGKLLLKIRVIDAGGGNANFAQILIRNFSKFIPFEMASCLFGRDKVLHDIIAKTRVARSEIRP